MSQYPHAPPPGAYVPPNEQQSQYSYQQPQSSPSPYQPAAPNHAPSHHPHKPSSTAAFGQMFNQAVTTGKPMLNKLGKTISSKLGNKPPPQSTPQHLQNFQSYQEHHQQQRPPQAQSYNPQPQQQSQQQQWGQTPTPNQPNAYGTPQQSQSPFPQSNYATPASGHSGQSTYFPAQQPQTSITQTPQQQSNAPGYSQTQFTQTQNVDTQQQGQSGSGQFQDGQPNMSQPPSHPQQGQFSYGPASGQQTGVVGSPTSPVQNSQPHQPPQGGNPQTNYRYSTVQPQQQQWAPAPAIAPDQTTSPAPQQVQPFNSTPPPQQTGMTAGPSPHDSKPHQQQHQYQPQNQPQHQAPQQWASMSPATPQTQSSNHISPPISPPPPQSVDSKFQAPPAVPSAVPSKPAQESGPTEFVAELPADMGNLSLSNNSKPQSPSYQAYQLPSAGALSNSLSQRFSVPRRAVSTSSLPLADPWRVADPASELPTREFYMIADLVFDALDRRFEPQNTGLLEASKVLQSWRAQGLVDAAAQLFEHNTFSAFGRIWSLKNIPHVLVPCQPSLMPLWNFQQQTHSQEMAVPQEAPSAIATYPSYMPALNRAGWYKYFFQEVISEPETLDKMMPAFCSDTYKPGVLNQPDLQRWDRTQMPGLQARVNAQREAVTRVCQEIAAEMQGKQGKQGPSEQEQQQLQNQLNQQMIAGGQSISMAAGNVYRPNYGGLV